MNLLETDISSPKKSSAPLSVDEEYSPKEPKLTSFAKGRKKVKTEDKSLLINIKKEKIKVIFY